MQCIHPYVYICIIANEGHIYRIKKLKLFGALFQCYINNYMLFELEKSFVNGSHLKKHDRQGITDG